MLGRLTLDAFPKDPITIGAAISMVVAGLFVIGFLSYTKR